MQSGNTRSERSGQDESQRHLAHFTTAGDGQTRAINGHCTAKMLEQLRLSMFALCDCAAIWHFQYINNNNN